MRPLVASIHLAALRHNYQRARQAAPGSRVFAVVKANAYGHGVSEVVTALAGAEGFAVACLEEALQVRALQPEARILLLEGCFSADEYGLAADQSLDIVLQRPDQLELLHQARLVRPLNVWLKLDSGMHRLGFAPDALRQVSARLLGMPQVASLNLLSHFACADEPGHPLTTRQLACVAGLQDLPFAGRSLANSAAVLGLPEAHLDWVRPGIMLYGAAPFAGQPAVVSGLQPVMALTAQLIAVREVAAGESIGYGASWIARQPSRIGTVSCGYADGYPRSAPAGTPVLVRGQRVPLAGRVSMDMLMVDLTLLPEARPGDAVELWGGGLPVDEVAQACGTIGYELLTRVTARVPRDYRD